MYFNISFTPALTIIIIGMKMNVFLLPVDVELVIGGGREVFGMDLLRPSLPVSLGQRLVVFCRCPERQVPVHNGKKAINSILQKREQR